MNVEFGRGHEVLLKNAKPRILPSSSFDIVFSEYCASIWCDPKLWLAEAARLLRPGGGGIFFRGSTLEKLCVPEGGPVGGRAGGPPGGGVWGGGGAQTPARRGPPRPSGGGGPAWAGWV